MTAAAKREEQRPFISLGTRLTVPVVLLVALVAAGAYFGLVRTSRVTALRSKAEAADMVIKLTSLSVMPAVVFGDETEMKRAVADLARNPQVTDVELWAFDESQPEHPTLASFHREGARVLERPRSSLAIRAVDSGSITAIEPVKGPDGKTIALLGVRFSTAREQAALEALSRQVLGASLGAALLLAGALLWVLRRLVLVPIRRLQQAARSLKSGQSIPPEAKLSASRIDDEVVQLAANFRDMAEAVRDRETRLGVRNAELRLILDSVEQGFLTLRPDGYLQAERSASVETWVGPLPEPCHFWQLVERIDPSLASWALMGWEQVQEGLLPVEVALQQLPVRAVQGERHFAFAYHPVMNGNDVERVVVVMTDVSAEVERQRALAEQHEFSVLVDQFVRDRRGFFDFWNEASALVSRIVAPEPSSPEALRRDLHTLKGNARFFNLTRLADICHALEDYLKEHATAALNESGRDTLREVWNALDRRMQPLVHGASAFIEIAEEEYERLVEALRARTAHDALLERVRGMRNEPTEWRLERGKEGLLQICAKLGKSPPTVLIEHNGLRFPPGRLAPFWSVLPHVLSNAADHGLETDAEREAAGKPLPAQVRLSTRLKGRELWVEVADDGRGIDWSRVRAKALDLGLPHVSQSDLEQILLADGFSLRSNVSEISGRGVGLAAVRSVVTALGGRVEVETAQFQGTVWRFRLPTGALHPRMESKTSPSEPRPTR